MDIASLDGERQVNPMINRQQALEIIEKFDFFQGQRAGRELWVDKPKEVQEIDLANFHRDCELLKEFIESQPERPKGRWVKDGDWLICMECDSEINVKNSLGVENKRNF